MAKYKVGQEFQHNRIKKEGWDDSVWFKILFVCPVDGYGVQKYVVESLSGYRDGAKHKSISLKKEIHIDKHFEIRDREFIWQ